MRILVDLRCLQSPPPRGGVGVFAERIARELMARDHENEYFLFANGLINPQRYLPQLDFPNVRWVVSRWPNKLLNAAASCKLQVASLPDADVIFLPNLNFLPPLPARAKLVVTVHDLSFEHFPDCFTFKQRLWHRAIRPRALLARADAIVAVSETTKRDVVETYGVPEEKVSVVFPGLSPSSFRGAESDEKSHIMASLNSRVRSLVSLEMTGRLVLSISELSPRKNLDGLIAAFGQLQAPSCKPAPAGASGLQALRLIIAGNHGSAEHALRRQISRSPARDRIHLIGPVSENEKHALLARASCFVYPSLWEGFGFPPLEAMAAGCPVVASTGGSLPEVLGDAALLVDPLDPAAIADAIARVLTDDTLRTDLIARGRTHATQYRWEDAARAVQEILQSLS